MFAFLELTSGSRPFKAGQAWQESPGRTPLTKKTHIGLCPDSCPASSCFCHLPFTRAAAEAEPSNPPRLASGKLAAALKLRLG